jgi:hypothetical protein
MVIHFRIIAAACGLIVFGATSTAAAQDLTEDGQLNRPNVEVGVFGSLARDLPLGIGARMSIRTADRRVAFEIEAEWADTNRQLYLPDQIVWHYVLQVRHDVRSSGQSGAKLFATYGVSGWSMRNSTPTGLRTSFIPPVMPTIGLGAQRTIASHLALRADVQAIAWCGEEGFLIPRLAIGASVGGTRKDQLTP